MAVDMLLLFVCFSCAFDSSNTYRYVHGYVCEGAVLRVHSFGTILVILIPV